MSKNNWTKGWFDQLQKKEEAKAKKKELVSPAKKKELMEGASLLDITSVPTFAEQLTSSQLFASQHKKILEQAFFGYSTSASSASSGELAYFDQPSTWKSLPTWESSWHAPAWSASVVSNYNYTQIFPVNVEPPMTVERAIALNNGEA